MRITATITTITRAQARCDSGRREAALTKLHWLHRQQSRLAELCSRQSIRSVSCGLQLSVFVSTTSPPTLQPGHHCSDWGRRQRSHTHRCLHPRLQKTPRWPFLLCEREEFIVFHASLSMLKEWTRCCFKQRTRYIRIYSYSCEVEGGLRVCGMWCGTRGRRAVSHVLLFFSFTCMKWSDEVPTKCANHIWI